jgi:hypothetical protein
MGDNSARRQVIDYVPKIFQLENEAKRYAAPSFLGPILALLALLPTFVSPFAATAAKPQARVAQLVERDLAKVEVASSNLVSRSKKRHLFGWRFYFLWPLV